MLGLPCAVLDTSAFHREVEGISRHYENKEKAASTRVRARVEESILFTE